MRVLITTIAIFFLQINSFGQQLTLDQFQQRLRKSPKDKLEYFKELAVDFTDNLDKSNVNEVDRAFIELLKVQTTIQNNYNEYIYESDDYNEIESIIYTDENLHTTKAKEFEKYVYENGFIIQTPEGTIFVEKNPDFLVKTFSAFLSDQMKSYLKQYTIEITEPFAEDGGINISFESFKQRVLFWENFEKHNPNFVLPSYTKNQYDYYLFHLLNGADNTPSFDWNTKKISESYFQVYNDIIQDFPNSKTANVLLEYLNILKLNEFKETNDVKGFIEKYNPYK